MRGNRPFLREYRPSVDACLASGGSVLAHPASAAAAAATTTVNHCIHAWESERRNEDFRKGTVHLTLWHLSEVEEGEDA